MNYAGAGYAHVYVKATCFGQLWWLCRYCDRKYRITEGPLVQCASPISGTHAPTCYASDPCKRWPEEEQTWLAKAAAGAR